MNKEKLALQSWEDVEICLGDISRLRAERDKHVASFKSQIAELTAKIESGTVDLDFLIRQHEQNITLFARAHLDEIRQEKKKSKEFLTGIIKTKEEEKYLYPSDDDLVEILKIHKLSDCLRSIDRPVKSVIKAKAKQDPEILEILGIEIQMINSIIIEAF